MPENDYEQRTFVKKVGGQTLTRRVTSPASEVNARFDGFVPEETAPTGEVETTAGTAQAPQPAAARPTGTAGASTRTSSPAAADGSPS